MASISRVVSLLDDIDDVVHRHHAHQDALLIHHGDGQQSVLVHQLGDRLLAVAGMGAHDTGVHDIPQQLGGMRQEQLAQGNDTH
jgi:hypothetical protein